jgi:hypothetical protein
MSSKQSFIICALSGALALSVGAAAFFYFQGQKSASVVAPAPAPAPAQVAESAPPPLPSGAEALKDLFGLAATGDSAKTAATELTTVWHQQAFTTGSAKSHVIFTQSQEVDAEGKPVDSHASAPLISAAVYELHSGKWELKGATKHFTRFGSWGAAGKIPSAQVVPFSVGTVAFLVEMGYSNQGYSDVGSSVWTYSDGKWQELGFVRTGADNGGAVGEDSPEYFKYTGAVSAVPGAKPFPDLLVKRTGKQWVSSDDRKVVPAQDVVYAFIFDRYREVEPASAANATPLEPEAASKLLASALERDRPYASWAKPGCLQIEEGQAKGQYIELAVREEHGGACGGDPNTAPLVDAFRIHRSSRDIQWMQKTTGNYGSYNEMLKERVRPAPKV